MKIIRLTEKNLKNIINQIINESMYARRRGKKIESYLEDALEAIDPLDYEDEFEYVDEVVAAVTDDLLSEDENIEFDSKEFHEMFDEISFFIRKNLYSKIQDHYDNIRTDY